VWLAISLSVVALGFVLLVLTALSAWRRWQKMRRAGGRFTGRIAGLAEAAEALAGGLADIQGLPAQE
jgi:hypothetical protein